jgi:hypothetical protein
MKVASLRAVSLLSAAVCICLSGGCQIQPQPRDLSGFEEFEFWSGMLPDTVGAVSHSLIRHEADQGYSLQISVVSVAGTQQTPGQTEDLTPRSLTDAEVQQMLGIFSDIRLEPYTIPHPLVDGIFASLRWDNRWAYSKGPGLPDSLSAETVAAIQAFMEDLAAAQ